MAGEIGVEFQDKTLRELVDMRHGAWNKVSALMAILAEINRNPEKKREPFLPADFHPFQERPKRQPDIVCKKGNWPKIEKLISKRPPDVQDNRTTQRLLF